MAISATCVWTPVFVSHSQAVHVEFTRAISPEEARRVLLASPGVRVLDDTTVSSTRNHGRLPGRMNAMSGASGRIPS